MKKLLATIIAAGAIAAMSAGVYAGENVVYEESFDSAAETLWGWSTSNNSVKKYNGYAELNTSGLGAEAALSKANGVNYTHTLAGTIADHYRTETSINLNKAVEKNMDDNVWAYKQETYNTKYNMSYAVCYDGIWVYTGEQKWVKGIDITNENDVLSDFSDGKYGSQASIPYNISVEANGAAAKITVTHAEKTYTYSWNMPGAYSYGPDYMNNIRMSSNSKGFAGYNMVKIDDVKIVNIFDNNVMVDNATDMNFANATYGSNIQAESFANYVYSDQLVNLSLKDRSASSEGTEANTIYYTIPEGAIVDNFYASTITPNGLSEVIFYGVKDGNKTKLTTSSNVVYVNAWGRHYYMPENISAYEYDGIAVELTANGSAGATLIAMQIEYEVLPEFYPLKASKEEVLIDDDFKTQKWHHENANYVEFNGWSALFNSKNQSNATMRISKLWRDTMHSATQMLMGLIGDNYKDYTDYNIQKLIKENALSQDGGGFGLKKTIVNGKYEMAYSVCYDGIYVKEANGWKKVKDIQNPENLYQDISDFSASVDYKMSVNVVGSSATLTAKYQDTKGGELKTFTYTWTMPGTDSWNDVKIESYVAKADNGRTMIFVKQAKLTNIHDDITMVDDAQKKYEGVIYGPNIQLSPISGYSQNKVISLINYPTGKPTQEDILAAENNNYVVYSAPEGGYLTDFYFTRRMNSTAQGEIYIDLISDDGVTNEHIRLEKDKDYVIKQIYLVPGHVCYYKPTDALKATLAEGKYNKMKLVLSFNGGNGGYSQATENSPSLMRVSTSYYVPDPYVLKDASFDAFDGNITLYANVRKNLSSAPNFRVLIASYDETGRLIEAKMSDEITLTTGLVSSPTIKEGASHKAFIWQTDETGNTTMIPIFGAIPDAE